VFIEEGTTGLGGNIGAIPGTAATGNIVLGNLIGTDATGTKALGNGGGVQVFTTASDPAALTGTSVSDNVVSGNGGPGILINGPQTSGTTVGGNFIGTDVTGKVALGNGSNGVGILGSNSNTITDNVISANGTSGNLPGVIIFGGGAGNAIQNNFIGTEIDGASALGNTGQGIQIISTATDTAPITGTTITGNVISGNGSVGLDIDGPQTTKTVVQGNKIGTDATGAVALPNAVGIQLLGSSGNTIGGAGKGNVVSGNKNAGVAINQGANNNTVQGNIIGLNAAGSAALGNGTNGLFIVGSGGNLIGGPPKSIGDTRTGAGNTISGNGTSAKSIPGVVINQTTSANTIQGNNIGTDTTGKVALCNSGSGIQIVSAAGDTTPTNGNIVTQNLIGGNGAYGLDIDGPQTTGTIVQNNTIGSSVPNKLAGIQVLNATGTIIGDATSSATQSNRIGTPIDGGNGNVISANTGGGVALSGKGNTLINNDICQQWQCGRACIGGQQPRPVE